MAKFSYKSKCAHPRKCSALMRKFIQDASNLTYELDTSIFKFTAGNLELEDGEIIDVLREVRIAKQGRGFSAYLSCDPEYIKIGYNFKDLEDEGHREFTRNIIMRDPTTKGFSAVTLSLLHELGHFATEGDAPENYDREKSRAKIRKWCGKDIRMINMMYFCLPDEYAATQWAIDWLSDEENRKRAKRFEKEFFKAWRGE